MKNIMAIGLSVLLLLGLMGCSKEVTGDYANEEDVNATGHSILKVRTRTADNEATISYPINIYVFQNNECKATQIISDEGQDLNIALTEGTYQVYAIGGASSTDYTLPASEATTTTAITLKEDRKLTDLMTAQATIELMDGETNTLNLGLERKVMLLQHVVIKKVPTTATAVSVTITPLSESLTVGTTYTGTAGAGTVTLTKQEDGRTWESSGTQYVMPPSSQPATITVRITTGEATKSYTYNASDVMEAGYKINIEGTYTEAVGVTLTGTMTGAAWKGERTILFDFNENSSQGSSTENNTPTTDNPEQGGNSVTGEIPAIHTLYKGCFVLSVTDNGNSADVLLVSPKEIKVGVARATLENMKENVENYINTKISEASVDDISDWRLPTLAELNLLRNSVNTANGLFPENQSINSQGMYLCTLDNVIIFHRLNTTEGSSGQTNFSSSDLIRPFVTVTISKE